MRIEKARACARAFCLIFSFMYDYLRERNLDAGAVHSQLELAHHLFGLLKIGIVGNADVGDRYRGDFGQVDERADVGISERPPLRGRPFSL